MHACILHGTQTVPSYNIWQEHLEATQLVDLLSEDSEPITDLEWESWFLELAPPDLRHTPRFHEWAAERRRELQIIRSSLPDGLLAEASQASPIDPFIRDAAHM